MSDKEPTAPKNLAERLAFLIKAKRMSQAVLANGLGVSQANVSRWLAGSIPETKFVVALSKRLDVSLEWLQYGAGSKPSALEAFLSEIRKHRVPAIDAAIANLDRKPRATLKESAEHREQLTSIRRSLIGLAEHAEQKGEIIAPSHLDNPTKYITKNRKFVIDEAGSVSRLSASGEKLDPSVKRAMICDILDLPVGASDQEIIDAHAKHMAMKKRKADSKRRS